MEHLINKQVQQIEISGIRRFFNLVAGIEGMVSLTLGQPDFPTPAHVKEAAKTAIDAGFTNYTHNAGFLELREAASEFYRKKYNVSFSPDSEVIITNGASQGIDSALRTILNEGDEVILPGPVYPGYEPIIRLCGATPVIADTVQNGFKLDAGVLKEYITCRTKCIILPYPSNPTGVSLTPRELEEIAELLRGKEVFILADEIYSELTYDRKHISIASYLKEQTIVINGLSKSHSMTGWRIGMVFAPENIAKHILKVHQYNVSCASSISQKAAFEALTNGIDDADDMRNEYKKRRDFVSGKLTAMGFDIILPDGAFYFFVKVPDIYQGDSFSFALTLAQQYKTGVVPGSSFSSAGEGFFRLSYACSMEELKMGMERLEAFLRDLGLKSH
ncbi:aminotransferase A [Bacillus salacetis]|uniref:Aminotransferase n=1 Tax=Bacillus salacetis TaxID=2315464 RepID=A0A3A1QWY5_9BACI|nr:aminotransferase A [Bacillus salacetis]RIW30148.1 aminotransferase A [Bacillus salacetis]